MIVVVYRGSGDIEQGTILFKVDAWDSDCEEKTIQYIRDHHWLPISDKITMMGDRIIEVA